MPDLVCFGEIMLRLSTPGALRFGQAREFVATFGGAESNVAAAVAQLGGSAGFVSRLPENEIAERALTELRGLGVDVSGVSRGGERLGVYYVEHGVSVRPSKVIYDRAHSAMAEAEPQHFDWEKLLVGARRFHWSGITPALSPAAPRICAEACAAARRLGVQVSFDVNYRAKLWSRHEAGGVLTPLMPHVQLCVTSLEEAVTIFGLEAPKGSDREEKVARGLCSRFGFETVALTMRESATAGETSWSALLYTEGKAYRSPRYQLEIVDRLGAGDSFSGALLFALMRGDDPQSALDLAVAGSSLKHTTYGDYNLASLAEVEALRAGGQGGRVQR